jgi:hypothetical protein
LVQALVELAHARAVEKENLQRVASTAEEQKSAPLRAS